MKNTLIDLSATELGPFSRVLADVLRCTQALQLRVLVTGAFARDIHLRYAHKVNVTRETEDIDIALAIPDWTAFARLKAALIETGRFVEMPNRVQRLRHAQGLPLDIVPFEGIESPDRHIAWPPDGAFRMNVFGYREALAAADTVRLPGNIETQVVSLAGLALLKIIAWQERHYEAPKKDASDLMLIARYYLYAGNEERLWSEFESWTQAEDFDLLRAGARMLGIDIARLVNPAGRERLAAILAREADPGQSNTLVREMAPNDQESARTLVAELLKGLVVG